MLAFVPNSLLYWITGFEKKLKKKLFFFRLFLECKKIAALCCFTPEFKFTKVAF